MLRKLTVENFFSIREAQTLDLTIARNAPDPDGRFATPIEGPGVRFPKVVALFGANASGKTTVLRAVNFLVQFIRNSVDWEPNSPLPYLSFQTRDWIGAPTKFRVELDAQVLEHTGRVLYVYELELAPDGKSVLTESLKYYPEGRQRWLFRRDASGISAGKDFNLPNNDPVRTKIRENASVISVLAKFNHDFSLALFHNLSGVYCNVAMLGEPLKAREDVITKWYAQTEDALKALNKEIRRFDLGIEEVVLTPTVNGVRPHFLHAGLDGSLAYEFESQGTTRFYNIFPYLYHVLSSGGLAVMDEFDNDIHALLMPELINLFQSRETNPNDAQILMSCHNPSVLECLSKEEIYFTEKDSLGRTEIYGLKDVQDVRRDANLYAKYLAGVFGAVPRIG